MELIQVSEKYKKSFEEFTNPRPETTCMQMWEWVEFRNRLGTSLYHRYGVTSGDSFVLTANFAANRYRPFGNVLYIPQGPIWENFEALDFFKAEIIKIARKLGCFLIVCEPRIAKGSAKYDELCKAGFTFTDEAVQPRETIQIDLSQSEEELMQSFSRTTKYNIRYAERKGVEILEFSSPRDVDRIKDFYTLLKLTQQRKYFSVQPQKFFEELWKEFSANGHAVLFEARYKGNLLNSLIFLHNDFWASSVFSASSRSYSNLKSTYLLRWQSIKRAKELGCKVYDFFGATSSNDPTHPFYSTTQSKLGFSKNIVKFAGTFEIVVNPIKYRLWKKLEGKVLRFYEKSFLKEFKDKNVRKQK